MTNLIRIQLEHSIAALSNVLNDDAVHASLLRGASITAEAMKSGKKLLICGNGGSAADAQHIATEFVSRLTVNRPALRAVALTTDTSALTAIGNDYGFENVFSRQVEALGQPGDVLLAISTSGNSPNCVKALVVAKASEIHTLALIGTGGAMAALAETVIAVPSSATQNIQECHLALEHIFCMLVERLYFGEEFGV